MVEWLHKLLKNQWILHLYWWTLWYVNYISLKLYLFRDENKNKSFYKIIFFMWQYIEIGGNCGNLEVSNSDSYQRISRYIKYESRYRKCRLLYVQFWLELSRITI